jgi:hypothetical protein
LKYTTPVTGVGANSGAAAGADGTTANSGAPAAAAVSGDALTAAVKRKVVTTGVAASCQLNAVPAKDWNHASFCG